MGNEKTNREFIYRFSRELATVICVRSEVFDVRVQERPAPQGLQPLVRSSETLPPHPPDRRAITPHSRPKIERAV